MASTGRNGQTRMFYVLRPSPTLQESGAQACCDAEHHFLLQASPTVWTSAWFSELVELSLLLPMRRHREEGGISSRTRGDHVPVPSCGSSVSDPCRAGMDGDVPFVSGSTSCTAGP